MATRTVKNQQVLNQQRKNNFTRVAHFFSYTLFSRFFCFFLHDYNVKLPSYTSYVRNVVCAHQSFVASVSVRFFHCCLLLWIKGYLDDNNEGKWKSFVNHYLEKHGCKLVFSANLKCPETHLLNISDPFVSRNCRKLECLKLYYYYSFKIFPQF